MKCKAGDGTRQARLGSGAERYREACNKMGLMGAAKLR